MRQKPIIAHITSTWRKGGEVNDLSPASVAVIVLDTDTKNLRIFLQDEKHNLRN